MSKLAKENISAYQRHTFRLDPDRRVRDLEAAVEFVNERGFIHFWPIQGISLPSLWVAAAGDRLVSDARDDPGHITWEWKDALLGSRRWYYAKVLRKRATMIAHDLFPYFYALSENYGAYAEDYLTLYEQGQMTMEARLIYEAILNNGPLDTVALRKAARMSSSASAGRFSKALTDLQADFKILPIGVTQSGAWHYAFAYEIVARHYPDLTEAARNILESEARRKLLERYALSLGAFELRQAQKLFGWSGQETRRAIDQLLARGFLVSLDEAAGKPGEWLTLPQLL
jgi:hypothetical protein